MRRLSTFLLVLNGALVLSTGCQPVGALFPLSSPGTDGGLSTNPADPGASQGIGSNQPGAPCSTRTMRTLPPPGPLTGTTNVTAMSTPPNSSLGKALGGISLAASACFQANGPTITEYELGEDGYLLDSDQRFIIDSGCLVLEMDENDGEDVDVGDLPFGRCRPGQVEISKNALFGPFAGAEQGDFICASQESSGCFDCSEDEQGWTITTYQKATYRALGSLDDVLTLDPCTSKTETVNVHQGDEVTITLTIETRYENK